MSQPHAIFPDSGPLPFIQTSALFRSVGPRGNMVDKVNPKMVAHSRHTVFIRGFPGDANMDEIRQFFCKEGSKCSYDFFSFSNDKRQLFVALRFESHELARDVMDRFNGKEVLGYVVSISWFKDLRKARAKLLQDRRTLQDWAHGRILQEQAAARRALTTAVYNPQGHDIRACTFRGRSSSKLRNGTSRNRQNHSKLRSREKEREKSDSLTRNVKKSEEESSSDDDNSNSKSTNMTEKRYKNKRKKSSDSTSGSSKKRKEDKKNKKKEKRKLKKDKSSSSEEDKSSTTSSSETKPTESERIVCEILKSISRKEGMHHGKTKAGLELKTRNANQMVQSEAHNQNKSQINMMDSRKLNNYNLERLRQKKEDIERAYKQDCETFATVVKMLISKDREIEDRLQYCLQETLRDIGQQCVEELRDVMRELLDSQGQER